MRNASRYIIGGIIGMCGEYLYRVGFSFYPVWIISALTVMLLVDVFLTDKPKS